jgi:hypothetical protein
MPSLRPWRLLAGRPPAAARRTAPPARRAAPPARRTVPPSHRGTVPLTGPGTVPAVAPFAVGPYPRDPLGPGTNGHRGLPHPDPFTSPDAFTSPADGATESPDPLGQPQHRDTGPW